MNRSITAFIVALFACLPGALFADEGPAKNIPELVALSHYVGDFDVAITSKESPFTKGESSTVWILDGRYVQQSGKLTSADGSSVVKATTLMTYDPEKKSYRMWSFLSTGEIAESTGKWDAKNRMMTSVGHKGDFTTTTTAKFTEDGNEEWSIVTTDQKNEVIGKFTGTNQRRKK